MHLKLCKWLVDTNPRFGNCYSACMFIHGMIKTCNSLEELEFIHLLNTHFTKINPKTTNLVLGDILCMCYSNGSEMAYQHAFIYLDEFTVFQRSGFEVNDKYEFCNIVNAVGKYSSKQVSRMVSTMCNPHEEFNNVKVVRFVDAYELNCVYRRNTQKLKCVIN